MADYVKIGADKTCPTCNHMPSHEEAVTCFSCKQIFHGSCEANSGNNPGTKTMVKTFLAISTKSNFKFYCDCCLTKMEIDLAATEQDKINMMEKKIASMETKLDKVVSLMQESKTNVSSLPVAQKQNVWHDKDRIKSVKVPQAKSVLIVKKREDETENKAARENIDKVIVENKLPVASSFTNRNGNLVVVCNTKNERNTLKDLVKARDRELEVSAPKETRCSITIVGLKEEYGKKDLIEMLILQNGFIKDFANKNDLNEHIEIHSVRPLKNNANYYQAFTSVSEALRNGLSIYGDKITMGLTKCKIYDRFHVKRCYKCQMFGHYKKDCSSVSAVCGKCASHHHETKDCDSNEETCINCTRSDIEDCGHQSSSYKCPSLVKQIEYVKKKIQSNLNTQRSIFLPHR